MYHPCYIHHSHQTVWSIFTHNDGYMYIYVQCTYMYMYNYSKHPPYIDHRPQSSLILTLDNTGRTQIRLIAVPLHIHCNLWRLGNIMGYLYNKAKTTCSYTTIQYKYNTRCYNRIQYSTRYYNTIQYNTNTIKDTIIESIQIQYKMLQYNTIQYKILHVQYNTNIIKDTTIESIQIQYKMLQ